MRISSRLTVISTAALLAHAISGAAAAHAQTVRTVLFFSPTCPHCHQVIREDLPVFFGMYGGSPQTYTDESVPEAERYVYLFSNGQLEVLLVNASMRAGAALYEASFALTDGVPSGVPRLVVDTTVLVGDVEIPNRLHGLIQAGLANGGIDWPDIDGLAEAISGIPQAAPLATLAAQPAPPEDSVAAGEPVAADTSAVVAPETPAEPAEPEPPVEAEPVDSASPDSSPHGDVALHEPDSMAATITALEEVARRKPSMLENFAYDPVGNGVSVLVLVGMILSLLLVTRYARGAPADQPLGIVIPLLSIAGAAVAAYLSYIEVGDVTAVCGPVGDCNTVNQSPYARLFGLLPVGVLGLVGYAAIIAAWIAARTAGKRLADQATVALFAGATFGTLFSVYLTFLEPFVIGATCMWCLSSAAIVTAIMWLSARPAWAAWERKGGRGR